MEFPYVFLFTKVASTEGFLVATGIILTAFLFQKDARRAVALFATAAGMILTVNVIKESLQVARPIEALIEVTGYAFPSGHAAGSAFLAFVVAYLAYPLRTPLRYLVLSACVLAALAIGASRIAFQVHTPVQVFAGYLIGALFAFIFTRFSTSTR